MGGNAAWQANEKQTQLQNPQLLLSCWKQNCSHPVSNSLFTSTHTQMEHFLRMHRWACGESDVLYVHVCKSEWQRGMCEHMHAQFFSLACRLAEIDGEKCLTRRKPVWCFKAWLENMQLYVNAWVSSKNTGLLTSLGRGSWACGWTWALGCSRVGGCWLLNDSSISPPDWWALLRDRGHDEDQLQAAHLQQGKKEITHRLDVV